MYLLSYNEDLSSDLTPLIPLLISLITPVPSLHPEFDDDTFIPASDALQEIMSKSALSDGSGSKTLVEPLLIWLERWGGRIVEASLSCELLFRSDGTGLTRKTFIAGSVDETSRSLCKLLVALGDHSTSYLAVNLASSSPVTTSGPPPPLSMPISTPAHMPIATPSPNQLTKGHLVQTFLKLLLAYTALPGFYGTDEDESEMTLGFWYLFQEALWSTDYYFEDEAGGGSGVSEKEEDQWVISKAVYSELVQVLRRKVVWPANAILGGWVKGELCSSDGWLLTQHFCSQINERNFECGSRGPGANRIFSDDACFLFSYRRDVGDALINA